MSDQTMQATTEAAALDEFYRAVMREAQQPTMKHAARTTFAVLHTLGFNLSGSVKKKLAKELPEKLARDLTRGWRLLHIRNRNLSLEDFAADVGLHSGNTDPDYAKIAIRVIFRQMKKRLGGNLIQTVARDLSPEVRALWDEA